MLNLSKKIGKIYNKHKFFLNLILMLLCLMFVIDLFIEENRVFLSGEFIFSFDYLEHFKNILGYFYYNPQELLNSTTCKGCYSFYHYSRWYALFNLSILLIGNLIKVNPFVYYVFASVIIQLIAIYVFVRLIVGKFNALPFLVGAIVFIAFPYKYALFASGSFYGFHHAFFILSITFLLYLFIYIKDLSYKKILSLAIVYGISSSFFLNMSIGYLPLFIYSTILISLFFWKKSLKYYKELLIFVSISGFLVVFINLPMILSFLRDSSRPAYMNFVSLEVVDSLTAYINYFGTFPFLNFMFFFIVGVLLIRVFSKKILLLLMIYISLSLILMGENSVVPVYEKIFKSFPLMDTIRSLHRFIFFQLIILFVIVYLGIQSFLEDKDSRVRILAVIFSFLIIILPIIQVYKNNKFIHTALIPQEYFETNEYFKNKSEEKIYFPSYMPLHNSISENYSWLAEEVEHQTSHRNPFTSIFTLSNIVHFEKYPPPTLENYELRSLTNYKHDPEEIVNALELHGIKYLIVDYNYNWSKNFPEFNIDGLKDLLVPQKTFGNIFIYRLQDKRSECKDSYGNFTIGYCFNYENPSYFIGKEKRDYILDTISASNIDYVLKHNYKENFYETLRNPDVQEEVLEKGILIPFDVYQAVGSIEGIYTATLQKGEYNLFIPMLSIGSENYMFGSEKLEVLLNNRLISSIEPQDKDGFIWNEVQLDVRDEEILSINTKGNGFIVIGNPVILSSDLWNQKIGEFSKEIEVIK